MGQAPIDADEVANSRFTRPYLYSQVFSSFDIYVE